jgi:hypothetical protein
VLAALIALSASAEITRAAWRRVNPELAIAETVGVDDDGYCYVSFEDVQRDLGPVDPWGRPWIVERGRYLSSPTGGMNEVWCEGVTRLDSAGPDGIDQGGRGDDIVVWRPGGLGPGCFFSVPGLRLYRRLRILAALVGELVVAIWAVARLLRVGEPRSAREAVVHASLVTIPSLLILGGTVWALNHELFTGVKLAQPSWLLVPWPVAMCASFAVLVFLVVLGVRLRMVSSTR